MSDKEHYQQKLQAQLDLWKAEAEALKAKAADATADAKIEMHKQVDALELKLEEGKLKLAEFADSGHEAWESLKDGAESVWISIKSAFSDAKDKFKH